MSAADNGYPETLRMTHHARERSAEMGISTKVAKEIYANRSITRPDGKGNQIGQSSTHHPAYCIVFHENEDGPVCLTVLFNTREFHERAGTTFIMHGPGSKVS